MQSERQHRLEINEEEAQQAHTLTTQRQEKLAKELKQSEQQLSALTQQFEVTSVNEYPPIFFLLVNALG